MFGLKLGIKLLALCASSALLTKRSEPNKIMKSKTCVYEENNEVCGDEVSVGELCSYHFNQLEVPND